ncbi:MAG: hypothetical protein JW941_09155, partial [Candidatus Coatesbacteria bacterium]|nr:hypothetical protein [Candidatus Coatesbacteria bacterium]
MNRKTMTIIILLGVIALCSFASAADHYVDVNSGNDANSGLSPDEAWKTITYATLAAQEEGYWYYSSTILTEPFVIHVAPGVYTRETGENAYDAGIYL